MTTIPHPRLPLADEQRNTILALGDCPNSADLARVRKEFSNRRNKEFPHWEADYNAAVEQWARSQGVRLNQTKV